MAWTNYLLGQIGSTEEEADTGATLGAFREAMHEAQALQMRPLLARSELGMGKLYWRLRDSEIACEHLNKAVAHFREMQMPHWLHEAEAQLRVLELN